MVASFISIFLSIFISSVPFLLLGCILSGIISALFSKIELTSLAPKKSILLIGLGCILGLIFPVGDAGVIPLSRRLMIKGLPGSFAIALLLAAPSLNLVAMASMLAAFGPGLLFWGRIGLTLLAALTAGLIFGLADRPGELTRPLPEEQLYVAPESGVAPQGGALEKSNKINLFVFDAADDFFYFGALLVIGAFITAGLKTLLPLSLLPGSGADPLAAVSGMGLLSWINSSNSMEIAFSALGFAGNKGPGPLLVFLTLGPLMDLKRIPMLLGVFRPKAVLYLGLLTLLVVLVMGVIAAYLFG